MLTIDINHPDLIKFVTIKQDLSKVTGANVSVMIRDEFMIAVRDNTDYYLRFPVTIPTKVVIDELATREIKTLEYNELYEFSFGHVKRVKAQEVWSTIINCAWKAAEPGIIFVDKQNNYSPSHIYPKFRNVTTNPCGEISPHTKIKEYR